MLRSRSWCKCLLIGTAGKPLRRCPLRRSDRRSARKSICRRSSTGIRNRSVERASTERFDEWAGGDYRLPGYAFPNCGGVLLDCSVRAKPLLRLTDHMIVGQSGREAGRLLSCGGHSASQHDQHTD